MADVDIRKTFGALLIGGLFATLLSGVVAVQTLIYLKLYPGDTGRLKALTLSIWLLDTLHTIFIWVTLWNYLIEWFGKDAQIDVIHWTLSITIIITAILTFLVHCFFAQRIFKLSHQSYLITIPILILAVLRLASASVTTGEMIALGSFGEFKRKFHWVFTLGLSLSTAVDILITGCLFFLLRISRSSSKLVNSNLDALINSLIMYSFETGAMTCAATIVAMLLWLTMPHNLIFMGLHFVIGKFYANSYLVTLNARKHLRKSSSTRGRTSVSLTSSKEGSGGGAPNGERRVSGHPGIPLAITRHHHQNRDSTRRTRISMDPSSGATRTDGISQKHLSDLGPPSSDDERDFEVESQLSKVDRTQALQVNVERSVVFTSDA